MQQIKVWKYIKTVFLFGTSAFVLAACGGGEAANEEETEGNAETITVEHDMGTAEIDGEPERVVTLFQGATDTAVALDIEPVGAVESWLEQPMYEYLRDDLENTEIVGDELQPNLEEIQRLEPDLIIGTTSRHEEVYDQLEQIAPTVMIDPLNDFKHTLNVMGESVNQEEKAENLLNDWNSRIETFQKQAESELDNWPMTASILNIRSDQVRMFVGGFPGEILNEAGFERTAKQEEIINNEEIFAEYTNTESIPEFDAETFFVFTQGNQEKEELEEATKTWTEHPLWTNLKASEDDEVHTVDEVTWNMGGGYIAANEMLDSLHSALELEE